MYEKLDLKIASKNENSIFNQYEIDENDTGNDFEKIMKRDNHEYSKIITFLENLDQCIFSRMTGSGSCCYAVFEKKKYVTNAYNEFKKKFPQLWTFVGENKHIID